jgi:ABC-type cobalamin/Fe3+-siderophores transport system ATPase subunit
VEVGSQLEYIKINKIHGFRNFHMQMDQPYKILVSENGQGKTTILKTINSIFSANLDSLSSINFEYAEVKFINSAPISIYKNQLDFEWEESKAYKHISRKVPSDVLNNIIEISLGESEASSARRNIKNYLSRMGFEISLMAIRDFIDDRESWLKEVKNNEFFSALKKQSKYESLYLPTYRRIEDELSILGISDEISPKEIIQFGLGDVERKLDTMKAEALTAANESMARINGEILTRLVNGLSVNDDDKAIIKDNANQIELVLKRVGQTLSETDKVRIIEMIQSGSIFSNSGNDSLIYFLSNMYKAFIDQRRSDEALSAFACLCSKYFVNKKMDYDERDLSIKITSTESGDDIKFAQLSSGEKQLVSIFSKLYLNPGSDFAVLFDEPELSLSVEWQKKIIHDVIASHSCGILITMTHSPFIFTGLTEYTSDLGRYFYQGK